MRATHVHHAAARPWVERLVIAGLLVSYVVAFVWLAPHVRGSTTSLCAPAVILSAWLYGSRLGAAMGGVAAFGNVLLATAIFGGSPLDHVVESLPVTVIAPATGLLVGHLKELHARERMHVGRLQRAEEARDRLIGQIVQAQELERRRVARELHDGVGQAITSLLMSLRSLEDTLERPAHRERAAHLRDVARGTLDEVRRVARGLHPAVLDDIGFVAALERHVSEIIEVHAVQIDLQIMGLDRRRLGPQIELATYRICQEALHNVVRHAEARAISVVLDVRRDALELVIEDDGKGCEMDRTTGLPRQAGLGLAGIRERASLFGGSLTVESSVGAGTALYVRLPVAAWRTAVADGRFAPTDDEVPEALIG